MWNVPVSAGLIAIAAMMATSQSTSPRAAAPIEPIAAVLEAFRTYQVVAIGDDHGNEQVHAFRLALIRDPRFASTVNDIVVEFGSARYQDVIDRFVHGSDVPDKVLRRVWQDTTQPEYEWDLPIYEEFFRAVRDVNAGNPPERHLRVLLGDPPFDWESVPQTGLGKFADRDGHAAGVIQRDVVARGRRALVIYGGGHLARSSAGGVVRRLEDSGIAKVFAINPETHRDLRTVHPAVAHWPVPSLAVLRGTDLGATNDPWLPPGRAIRMENQYDALLYLGPLAAMSEARLAPALCRDAEYMQMRLARLAMVPPPPGALVTPAARLKEYCANPDANREIADNAPQLTELVRATIREAAAGTLDPERFAPESRERLLPLLKQIGARFLHPAGALDSLVLLTESTDAGTRTRRYRAVFANGQRTRWTVVFSPAGAIMSVDPRPE